MTKEDKKREEEWKVEDAVRTLQEYQKIIKDKDLKEKALNKLKEKAKEYEKLSDELK